MEILGFKFNLLTLTIYLASTWAATEWLKQRLTWHPVFISWAVGLPIFFLIGILKPSQVTWDCLVQFFFLTLLLNGGIKAGHTSYDFLASKFTFLKERDRHIERRTGMKIK